MIKNTITALLCGLMIGCGTIRVKYISDQYSEMDSPCFDGLLLNLEESKCREIKAFKIPHTNVIKLECVASRGDDPWLDHVYYVIPMSEIFYFEDEAVAGNLYPFPVCVDPIVIVGSRRIDGSR